MLENGGFEEGYRPVWDSDTQTKPHHIAYVHEVDCTGGPITKRYTVERAEIHNPVGWWSWYAHQRNDETPVPWDPQNRIGWSEPEIRLTETVHQRHRSGAVAAYTFTWRRIHEAGLFQQVQVTPGAHLRFTAYTHAWIGDDAHPPTWSLPGYGALAWPAGTPGLNDDQRSVTQSVGIDPTGGIDPYAPTVVWSPGWHIFNAYRVEPLAVEAVAAAATVTVFLRSSTLWPVVHNDVAWDDCELTVVDTPDPCRGKPRVQYERTYLLLHPNESAEMRRAATDVMLALNVFWTMGPSADDGGIGDLDYRRVIAVNPELWVDDLWAFYADHYPGVEYQEVVAVTPTELLLALRRLVEGAEPVSNVTPFSQNDPRWENDVYSGNATFGQSGCLVTCIAMLAGSDPPETARRLRGVGAFNGAYLSNPQRIPQAFAHLEYGGYRHWRDVPADLNLLRQEIIAHGATICEVRWDPAQGGPVPANQHFVVVEAIYADDALIVDPFDGQRRTLRGSRYCLAHETAAQALTGVRLVRRVSDPVPETGNGGQLLGLHLQSIEPGALEFIARVKPNVVKVVADPGIPAQVKQASPGTLVVYRHHLTRQDELACLADPVNRARWYLDQFAAQIGPLVDAGTVTYLETGINETMDGGNVPAAIAFEHAFIAELARRIPKAKPVVATIAVGNPHESQFPLLVPLAREVAQVKGAFGYHAYWPVDHGLSYLTNQWRWHAGRFAEMDDLFRRQGIAVDWILGECGPCAWNFDTNEYNPDAGWRHAACFNGNFERTLEDVLEYDELLRTSPARVLGATWFTIYGQGWEHFNLNAQQLARLAQELTR